MRRALAVACFVILIASGVNYPAAAQGTVAILIPGAGGPVPSDFLMRNIGRFNSAGVETVVATSPQQAISLAGGLRAQQRKAVIVGMSRGGQMAANALAGGAPVVGAVFVSSGYDQIRSILGSPARLPPTLVVHHRLDRCPMTLPTAISPFSAWAKGKVSVAVFDNQGAPVPNECGPRGAHGYFMDDASPIAAIVSFVRSR
jgi:dienelactone hydrolase